eukprot:s6_g13.t2
MAKSDNAQLEHAGPPLIREGKRMKVLLSSGGSKVVLSIRHYLTLKACLGGLCQKLLVLFGGQGYLSEIDT